jgi:hypothetical protein
MPNDQDTRDDIAKAGLLSLIETCANCQCPPDFPCYCAKNLMWAEEQIERLRARRARIT